LLSIDRVINNARPVGRVQSILPGRHMLYIEVGTSMQNFK